MVKGVCVAEKKQNKKPEWDMEFVGRHNVAGPRYTSYPTALQFHEEFTAEDYSAAVVRSNNSHKPLSLYVHLPFCESLCYYCACNKVVTSSEDKKRAYLDALKLEIRSKAAEIKLNRPIYQMHWGGGTPTYYNDAELTELWFEIGRCFHLVDSERGEYSIEIDPRTVSPGRLSFLRGLGFNRISLGIQDFDLKVQRAIHREQSLDQIAELMVSARELKFRSVNFDLIYGLPHQTEESVAATIHQVVQLAPDRISLFNYAHLPERFKAQRLLPEEEMPSADEKLRILCSASNLLLEAGYVYIGMDHFAKPSDELAIAQAKRQLHRNFQGYTTYKEADLIGLGVSAISLVNDTYCQNSKSITEYQERLQGGESPINCGVKLTLDDEIRRSVIMSLLCQNQLDPIAVSHDFGIDFGQYFMPEIVELQSLVDEKLLDFERGVYQVTPKGRLVVRKICMVFDGYLPNHLKRGHSYSKVI